MAQGISMGRDPGQAPAHTALLLCSLSLLNISSNFCYCPLPMSLVTTSATQKSNAAFFSFFFFFLPVSLAFHLFTFLYRENFFLLPALVYGKQWPQLLLFLLLVSSLWRSIYFKSFLSKCLSKTNMQCSFCPQNKHLPKCTVDRKISPAIFDFLLISQYVRNTSHLLLQVCLLWSFRLFSGFEKVLVYFYKSFLNFCIVCCYLLSLCPVDINDFF